MHTAADNAAPHSSEPSPGRRSLQPTELLFGLAAPPLAWVIQLIVNVAIVNFSCRSEIWSGSASVAIYVISGAALLISLAALLTAFRAWRSVKSEAPGSPHELVDAGEGRSRFFAFWAVVISVVFSAAIIVSLASLLLTGSCA